jgi:glycosyltransferase involved in cell wall biosynthesis
MCINSNFKDTLAKNIQTLLSLKRPSKIGTDDFQLLLESEYFDTNFYRAVAGLKTDSSRELVNHYFFKGADLGLNPSELFFTEWYRQAYPDVTRANINPLFHFVKFGEAEGRSPCPETHDPKGFTSPNICGEKLWGGFSNQALSQLGALAISKHQIFRIQSLWHMANWHYVHGNQTLALKQLQQLVSELDEKQGLTKRLVVSKCKCLLALDEKNLFKKLIERSDIQELLDKDLPYIKANLAWFCRKNETEWLQAVNELYISSGLARINKYQLEKPLSLDNLGCDFSPEYKKFNQPKVSVIIPAFNASETIHIAINSLIAQTWSNLEIIVVDDASTDDTSTIVQNFGKQAQIKYFRNEQNLGAYQTRNRGFQQSTGEYITVHDSDDWSHPQKIEKQMEALLADDTAVACLSNWAHIDQNLAFVGPWMLCEDFIEKNHSSTLIHRAIIEKHGLWDAVNVAADSEFLNRLEKIYGSERVLTVMPDTPLSFALTLDDSLTQKKSTHVKTFYHGLRRLYHEAASWWHDNDTEKLYLDPSKRKFPVPLGNLRGSRIKFDAILAGDFSTGNEKIEKLLDEVKTQAEEKRIALFHWPDYRQITDEKIAPQVFELCMALDLSFTHAGYELSATLFCLFDGGLAEWLPDELPKIRCLQEVVVIRASGQAQKIDANSLKERLTN